MYSERSLEQGPSLKKLIYGEGFSEILRYGWHRCRERIKETCYADWIDAELQRKPKDIQPPHLPTWIIHEWNIQALERILEFFKQGRERFPPDRNTTHKACFWQDRGKKIFFGSPETPPRNEKITRLYLHVRSRSAPEAFRALCIATYKNGAIASSKIAFNLENYQQESLDASLENNTLIVYIRDTDPRAVDKMIEAIHEARQTAPEAWTLLPHEIASTRKSTLRDFLLPLDHQVALVEQIGEGSSYHADIYPHLYEQITQGGSRFYHRHNLQELRDFFKPYRLRREAAFIAEDPRWEGYKFLGRKRYLPALVNLETS